MSGSAAPPHSLVSGEVAAALCARAAQTPPGCFVEVGVFQGGTAWHLAQVAEAQNRALYLYDTFCGIPYKGERDSHQVGDFKETSADAVHRDVPYATIIEGVFPESALEMGPIAFVHLDCDQYESYRSALEYFGPRMVRGGIIWLDDFGCLAGADHAVLEFMASAGVGLKQAEKAYLFF